VETMCAISGCKQKGQLMATLGTMKIYYCSTHHKQGEAIIDNMLKAKAGYKV